MCVGCRVLFFVVLLVYCFLLRVCVSGRLIVASRFVLLVSCFWLLVSSVTCSSSIVSRLLFLVPCVVRVVCGVCLSCFFMFILFVCRVLFGGWPAMLVDSCLMSVVHGSLLVVGCLFIDKLLVDMCCSVCDVCFCLLLVVCCPSFVFRRSLFVVRCLLVVVWSLLFVLRCLLFVGCKLLVACCVVVRFFFFVFALGLVVVLLFVVCCVLCVLHCCVLLCHLMHVVVPLGCSLLFACCFLGIERCL